MNILFTKNFLPRFFVSRKKTLLKRRKIAIKKRPISQKKLKQQAKIMNYSLEYKTLQLKKQMDKRANPNRHVNELMDQIFYPDITYANQQALKKSLQLQKKSSQVLAQQQQQNSTQQGNQVLQKIKQLVLPQDIFTFHEQIKKWSESMAHQHNITPQQSSYLLMNHQYYKVLLNQICKYFQNRISIKNKLEQDWESKMNKMKNKKNDFIRTKCPYNFYDAEDIYLCKQWIDLMSDLGIFIEKGGFHLQNQEQMQQDIANMFEEINTAISLYEMLRSLPAQIYNKMIYKIVRFTELSDQENVCNYLTLEQKTKIIQFVNLRQNLKHSQHSIVELSQNDNKKQGFNKKINQLSNYLCMSIINDQKCDSSHFSIVLHTYNDKTLQFTKQFEQLSKILMLKEMSELSYQKIVDYFVMYLQETQVYDQKFIQLIKFDIFRKSSKAISKKHLFQCLSKIKQGRFINKKNPNNNNVPALDLYIITAQTISSKYCGKNMLSPQQIKTLIQSYIQNHVNHINHSINLLQLMANQLVRNKEAMRLEDFAQCGFALNILGYKSPILAQVIFQQFIKNEKYRKTYKNYAEKQKYLLTQNQQNSESTQQNKLKNKYQFTSLQTIQLQQSLILCIWMLISSVKQFNQSQLSTGSAVNNKNKLIKISTDKLMKIYPIKIQTNHILMQQLCKNIYEEVKQYGMFQVIRHPSINRLQLNIQNFKKEKQKIYDQNDRFRKYYQIDQEYSNRQDETVSLSTILRQQAKESQKFIYNYNIEDRKYIQEAWSNKDVYEYEVYMDWVWAVKNQQKQVNYFNKQGPISQKLARYRKKIITFMDKNIIRKGSHEDINKSGKDKSTEQEYEYYKLD